MKKRQDRTGHGSRRIGLDKGFIPAVVDDGDELFANGIFVFNVSKMQKFLEANPDTFPIEQVEVEALRNCASGRSDEETIRGADLSVPIILAEISPGRFNVIDGNHRMERAGREGIKTIPVRRIRPAHHVAFLTSGKAYVAYVEYWNSKIDEAA